MFRLLSSRKKGVGFGLADFDQNDDDGHLLGSDNGEALIVLNGNEQAFFEDILGRIERQIQKVKASVSHGKVCITTFG